MRRKGKVRYGMVWYGMLLCVCVARSGTLLDFAGVFRAAEEVGWMDGWILNGMEGDWKGIDEV